MAPLLLVAGLLVPSATSAACGEVHSVGGHDGTTTRYSLGGLDKPAQRVLVLLPGGNGYLKLDAMGCPGRLKGNSLVRKRSLLHAAGVATALVDVPSDHQGKEGLGGFRIEKAHADDLGKVVADLRRRTGLGVWLAGTSRGAISAVNAASRLTGDGAPDGLILTSPVTSGNPGAWKEWVRQTVFSLPLNRVKMPVLVIVHADDKCVRTPPVLGPRVIRKTNSRRSQAVSITGGPGWRGPESVKACRGRAPHGFVDQEATVVDGMVRFMSGGRF